MSYIGSKCLNTWSQASNAVAKKVVEPLGDGSSLE